MIDPDRLIKKTNQPKYQSTKQPINQNTNQPNNQSTKQPINQKINQPKKPIDLNNDLPLKIEERKNPTLPTA